MHLRRRYVVVCRAVRWLQVIHRLRQSVQIRLRRLVVRRIQDLFQDRVDRQHRFQRVLVGVFVLDRHFHGFLHDLRAFEVEVRIYRQVAHLHFAPGRDLRAAVDRRVPALERHVHDHVVGDLIRHRRIARPCLAVFVRLAVRFAVRDLLRQFLAGLHRAAVPGRPRERRQRRIIPLRRRIVRLERQVEVRVLPLRVQLYRRVVLFRQVPHALAVRVRIARAVRVPRPVHKPESRQSERVRRQVLRLVVRELLLRHLACRRRVVRKVFHLVPVRRPVRRQRVVRLLVVVLDVRVAERIDVAVHARVVVVRAGLECPAVERVARLRRRRERQRRAVAERRMIASRDLHSRLRRVRAVTVQHSRRVVRFAAFAQIDIQRHVVDVRAVQLDDVGQSVVVRDHFRKSRFRQRAEYVLVDVESRRVAMAFH